MRIEDRRGISHLTLAQSKDGMKYWQIDPQPTLIPKPDQYPEEIWGIEDPRITFLEEDKIWAITYTAYSRAGPLVSLIITTDFKKFTEKDFDKDGDDDYSLTKEVESSFHESIYKKIDRLLTDCDLQYKVLEYMVDFDDYLPPKVKEFGDLGKVEIRFHKEDVPIITSSH